MVAPMERKPRVLFVGSAYAGHQTRFANLREYMRNERRLDCTFVEVTGWRAGGLFERMPVAPKGLKGRFRSAWDARSLAMVPRPDVIWTSATDAASWYAWANTGPLRVPLIYDTDASYEQLNNMSREYFDREPTTGAAFRIRSRLERGLLNQVTIATPWSRWAAEGLVKAGLPPRRIRVSPPGVDVERWIVPKRRSQAGDRPLRLLFVGGNFKRKGGDLLLRAVVGPLRGLVVLDVVTRDEVPFHEGVEVHRAEANSPALMDLYAQADVFVLPTRAECFGIAAVEALASGLPVMMTDVGGAKEIVKHDENGWLISPTVDSIVETVRTIACQPALLPAMARNARNDAEQRFDASRNHRELADLIHDVVAWRRAAANG